MAKVQVQVTGGAIQQKEVGTVGDVKSQYPGANYTATVNGEPADDSYVLSDYEFITLTESVKGA